MAYIHHQRDEYMLTSVGNYSYSADIVGYGVARWGPGYQPVVVRGLWVQNLTTIIGLATGIIGFYKNTAAVLTTATGNHTIIDTVNLSTVALTGSGTIYYVECVPTKIAPGQEVVLNVDTATSEALIIRAGLYVEATSDAPSGNTKMVASS